MRSVAEHNGSVDGVFRTHITRRELLRHAATAIGVAALNVHMTGCGEGEGAAAMPQSAPPDPLSGDALYRDVVAYSSMGDHRTATDVDARTSDWIRTELLNAGLAARALPFTVRQFFPRSVRLQVSGEQVGAFPYWPPGPTGPAGIHAVVAAFRPGTSVSVRGQIAIVEFPFNPFASSHEVGEYVDLITRAVEAGALDVVAVTAGPTASLKPTRSSGAAPGELGLVAERYRTFFGITAAHMFHHTPGDGPETTAPELLEPVGQALAAALEAIEARATA